jgi:hypothetical protein
MYIYDASIHTHVAHISVGDDAAAKFGNLVANLYRDVCVCVCVFVCVYRGLSGYEEHIFS